MPDLLFAFSLFYFSATVLGLLIATYTDFKNRIVPNWLTFGMIALGLLGHALQSYIVNDWTVLGICIAITAVTFIVSYILWKLGVWAGGDVKLFTGIAALNPFNLALLSQVVALPVFLQSNFWPLFPLTLFIFTLFAMLPYACLLSGVGLAKSKEARKALKEKVFPEWKRVCAFAFYAVGFGVLLSHFALPWWLLFIAVFVAGFIPIQWQYMLGFVSIAGLVYFQQLVSIQYAVELAVVLGIVALLWNLQKIAKEFVLIEWKQIKNLKDGDILADSFEWKKGKLEVWKRPSWNNLLKLKNAKTLQSFLSPRLALHGSRAAGLSLPEIAQLKKWERTGKWKGKVKLKKSAPLAPAVLIAYVVLNLVGDVFWYFI
ncbi:MAG: A24 family peptidase [Candidatus Diapherotrites archaeon]